MLHVKSCLTIILTLYSLLAGAQDSVQWATRIDEIVAETDPNFKRDKLQKLSRAIADGWDNSEDIEQLGRSHSAFHLLRSDNGKMEIAVLGAVTYTNVFQLDWIVNTNDSVYVFSDELPYNSGREGNEYQYDLHLDGAERYHFRVRRGKQLVLEAHDVLTKCWFEDLHKPMSDDQKEALNQELQERLMKLWEDPAMYENTFPQLKRMKTLLSDDHKVKVCTYNIQKQGFKQVFYGAVILNEGDISIRLLNDESDRIRSPERSSLSNKKWYGAIYLDMIQTENSGKTLYTLLGYRGHDEFMKTRVLDVLQVQNGGRLRFGLPVFKTDRLTRNRIVFQYSAKTTMMMRYDRREKMIVFDNLAPADPMFRNVYQYYGPDFSYNAFKFSKGLWQLKKDIDLRNPKR
ncbi:MULTISPECIES: hypothetical protein [unclassified Carboxylicivirga]|uniref:hypothetical protein n=1 Tax=Carboxylicivirga TaxID=1628153 RepID=UPI003D337BED